ncbi:S26 family signal peptidase [Pseudacidovorax intermedius]|uniref:S26 family signal peptidase n=1 Tax=Pseudacidovorax intermedius TaxID=433924 RepID=UPI0026EEBF28|nr:S26 family signal peptidase [Pseudacidovorax intermedius]
MKARRTRVAFLAATLLVVTALGAPCVLPFRTRLVFNPSTSMARGWYRVNAVSAPGVMHVGSLVLARLPASAAALAAQRHYLPAGTPVLKRVAAVAPQSVCIARQRVWIDARAVAVVRLHDGAGRSLPIWAHCGPLADGELFLVGDAQPVSFDSRYFGPVRVDAVLGIAHPLWTW